MAFVSYRKFGAGRLGSAPGVSLLLAIQDKIQHYKRTSVLANTLNLPRRRRPQSHPPNLNLRHRPRRLKASLPEQPAPALPRIRHGGQEEALGQCCKRQNDMKNAGVRTTGILWAETPCVIQVKRSSSSRCVS